ncbi:Homeodomain-like domain-containing protein [Armatimonadetes bacterium GXS]|nr:Homeodomain-like domain-containing protein [Armatimonadetes bacterium GXS]
MRRKIRARARKAILQSLSQGATISQACASAGVSRRAFYDWLKNDPRFAEAVEIAQGKLIALAEGVVLDAIRRGDLKAAAWWLERRVPEYRPPHLQPRLRINSPEDDAVEFVYEVVDAPTVSFDELLERVLNESASEPESAQTAQLWR